MSENETAKAVVDAAFQVHVGLGPGLLESIYHRALAYELQIRGLEVQSEVAVRAVYKELVIDPPFRMDLVVNGHVVVELKSVERTEPVHKKQLLTYLKLSGYRLGLLINFGAPTLKQGLNRIVNGLPD